MKSKLHALSVAALALLSTNPLWAEDSLPPLDGRPTPTNITEMWQGFDPLREPLDTEIVWEWTEGDATYRYVIFTIGTFKGQKSRVAAFYGFPKSDKKLPAVMHMHGGGQRAFIGEVKSAVKYGFAGLSVNWGGKEMEGAKPGDKNTDYNAINLKFNSFKHDRSLDPGTSPRNEGWFLATLVGRRGITFLQQQPEVDPLLIGVHGHSMGGKLTVDISGSDSRVIAAVPSCGSSIDIVNGSKIWNIPNSYYKRKQPGAVADTTINSVAYLPTLTCPILDLNPTNDHHSPFDMVMQDWEKIGSKQVYHSAAPHLGHAHLPETKVTQWLWFEQWLQHSFKMPQNPEIRVDFTAKDGVPRVVVKPDASRKIKAVDIYYSTEPHIITRFWRDGEAKAKGDTYEAVCPILGLDKPFYAFANITYELEAPFNKKYEVDCYIITSKELLILPNELVQSVVKATDQPTRLVEDFSRGWHDWQGNWGKNGGRMTTAKIKDPKWRGPDGESLCLEIKSAADTSLDLSFNYNRWESFKDMGATGNYNVTKKITGSPEWQTISVSVAELQPSSDKLVAPPANQWQWMCELSLKGKVGEIRKIYWAKVAGAASAPAPRAVPTPVNVTPQNDMPELAGKSEEFKAAVRKSLEEEKQSSLSK